MCVFTSSFGWVAVRAAHITLRSHESADAACGSFRLFESKKRLGRRIRRSGSGTLHLFSHPVSPTLSDPRACSFACFCTLQRREWTVILITAIMYLRNNSFSFFHKFFRPIQFFSQKKCYMHRHAQHLLKCQNELHTAEGESKARQAVLSSCLEPVLDADGSVPHPRDGDGGRRG